LNIKGGVEADLTVTHMRDECYLVVTAAFTATHVRAWIAENIPQDSVCVITDVSGAYAMLSVQGPESRALLSGISTADFSTAAFPFGTMQQIEIGYQSALAIRIAYTGELGWELYIPTEMTLGVYDQLIEAGDEHGLKHCGYHTLNSLRIEKAYREWSHDMGPTDTLLECGLGFTCAWEKAGGFIGRDALQEQRSSGPLKRRLVQVLVDDPEPILVHNEPILRDGERVGFTTSAGYAHTLGASAAMAYISHEDGVTEEYITGGDYTLEQADRTYGAQISLTPMYDPTSARARS
jgi:4-methylaminobutanoate oxidase (formaldehyde-forming)